MILQIRAEPAKWQFLVRCREQWPEVLFKYGKVRGAGVFLINGAITADQNSGGQAKDTSEGISYGLVAGNNRIVNVVPGAESAKLTLNVFD